MLSNMNKTVLFAFFLVFLTACDFEVPEADEKFGKQNFVSAVSIIEMHKLRNGEYPNSLKDLEFLGEWDGIWLSAVKYEKEGDGYNLYVERGWAGKPSLEISAKFKKGLGIRKSNIKWLN